MATNTFSGNVAAIDFGTTFCSLSYQVPGYERKTLEISSDDSERVPTALLVKRTGSTIEVVEIGSKAQFMYKSIPNKNYNDYVYFECFKMQLRDESVSHRLCNRMASRSIILYIIIYFIAYRRIQPACFRHI